VAGQSGGLDAMSAAAGTLLKAWRSKPSSGSNETGCRSATLSWRRSTLAPAGPESLSPIVIASSLSATRRVTWLGGSWRGRLTCLLVRSAGSSRRSSRSTVSRRTKPAPVADRRASRRPGRVL